MPHLNRIAALGVIALTWVTSGCMRTETAEGGIVRTDLGGGAFGVVRADVRGVVQPVDGLMVQLISHETSIRTTVYTNEAGQFEFPELPTGDYVLRVPRPLHFNRYMVEAIRIDGATPLPEIRVEPRWDVSEPRDELLPPTPDLLDELTGAEWLFNMPGSAEVKRHIVNNCAMSCHGSDRLFTVRFDQHGWERIVDRMTNYGHRILTSSSGRAELREDARMIADWLATVQGLDSEMPRISPFPRPSGPATRAVVTEYELPWALVNIHDVAGDAEGNIFFNINRSPFIGKLNPETGEVTQYRIPDPEFIPFEHPQDRYAPQHRPTHVRFGEEPGINPGLHWMDVDEHTGLVWFTAAWPRSLGVLDPRTGDVRQIFTGMQGNHTLHPDGRSVWRTHQGKIWKFDTSAGLDSPVFDSPDGVAQPVQTWDLEITSSTYGNFVSPDGRYFGGAGDEVVWLDIETGEVREIPLMLGGTAGRGSFDYEGNIWSGSRMLAKYDPVIDAVTQYEPPTPYFHAYSTRVDKNGEIWSGQQSSGRVFRFNPVTHRWIEYVLPSPFSFDFNSWIDNSTDPPTFWYGDQHGYIVRIQPLE